MAFFLGEEEWMKDNISPGGILNPGRLWRAQIQAWEKTPGQSCRETGSRKKTASGYVEKNSLRHAGRVQSMLEGLDLKSHYRILDIGAGAGTLAIPMAGKVRQVTAVDPSTTMCSVLTDYVTARGIINISCIQRAWEDPDIMDHLEPPYDVVVASLSPGNAGHKRRHRKNGNGGMWGYCPLLACRNPGLGKDAKGTVARTFQNQLPWRTEK